MLFKISSKLLLSVSSLKVSAEAGARLPAVPGGGSGSASPLMPSGDCGGSSSLRRAVEGWVPLRGMVAGPEESREHVSPRPGGLGPYESLQPPQRGGLGPHSAPLRVNSIHPCKRVPFLNPAQRQRVFGRESAKFKCQEGGILFKS